MSKEALDLMIKRKKLVRENGDPKEIENLLAQAEKVGGLTVEEKYILALAH